MVEQLGLNSNGALIASEEAWRRGLTTRDTDAFLFATTDGEHLDCSNWLHRIWYPARQQAGVEWV